MSEEEFSSSATSEEDVVTLMIVVRMSSRILRRFFFVTFSFERNSAAVLTEPVTCAILKTNCNTNSHAFHSAGGIAFVWKNDVKDLFSVRTIVGIVASHKMYVEFQNSM